MLVVSRNAGEGIVIDGGIKIKIFEIKGDSVKIGIEAPKQTLILRDELVDSIKDENIQSAASSSELLDSLVSSLSMYKKDK
ncbi:MULTISPECIES: carbon storage regulator CsrA [unclassified Campylobacter]|uniref:carbon storage regulator CsrA n=1 Tax=unclassified Campylobacter TaxID=2593542 RepID=UPI001BDAF1C7|nr:MULTISPECIES: carbon storage regulator CsrA [unclassified Campylobacter]MBZ7975770.1 carbon storage regulator CsrA [Campylobacter sp. RM12637]MBZ7978188.1 carbon storage regulator CsrA [Campylobacter sp. RM12654]MBZ7979877.1 carbon storage regulator CsrA [Campylobacter sp. RM12642]MBZ7981487.1 carbon storage regulator CsrA [Campylobacter sp. RM12640]MBZ7983595.1 carbon storage regulator CsrA [Campylobacter sp. RM12647]MBZ7989088.1 carbon storage regulator CsrA [Campylobacter sp. RM12635]M